MVLLGDDAQMEALFGLFGDRLILTQDRSTLCAECTIMLGKHFGHTRWNTSVMWVMWNVGVRCTVCAKLSIAIKFILDTPDGTPR
jgi:hypothetical protein